MFILKYFCSNLEGNDHFISVSGKVMEYDAPMNLMKIESSLFGQLVKEYWSRSESTEPH
jgi:hypothetical protein